MISVRVMQDVGSIRGLEFYRFGASGRIAGVLVGVSGRAYVVGFSQRGLFWRFGSAIYGSVGGYRDGIFGLRTGIGAISLMVKAGIRDEVLPVRFRPNRLRGSIHFSRTGVLSFVLGSTRGSAIVEADRKNWEIFSPSENEDVSFYQSGRKE